MFALVALCVGFACGDLIGLLLFVLRLAFACGLLLFVGLCIFGLCYWFVVLLELLWWDTPIWFIALELHVVCNLICVIYCLDLLCCD